MSSTREFTLVVPGAEPRDAKYDLWEYVPGELNRHGETDTEDLGSRYLSVIHRLQQEFDRFRGIDGAITAYKVAAFWEIPPGVDPIDDITGDAVLAVYIHPTAGIWSDDTLTLRAVIEHDQTIQELHYGTNEAGLWTFTDLAVKRPSPVPVVADYERRVAAALAYIGPATELEYADVDVAEVKRILEGR